MWFTETPWPPVILLGSLGFISGLVWGSTQRSKYLVAAVGCVLIAAVIWIIERQIVTEAEKIEQQIYDLAAAFQRNDMEKTVSYFSQSEPALRTMAALSVNVVDIEDDYRITDMDVRTMANDSMGESWFRVNVTATHANLLHQSRQSTRWKLIWRKEAEEWKIIEVHSYKPLGNEEIYLFGQLRN